MEEHHAEEIANIEEQQAEEIVKLEEQYADEMVVEEEEQPEMPLAQSLFGGLVYWLCVVAGIACMIGPVIALASIDGNVGNPQYLYASIFEGDPAEVVWEQVAGEFPGGHFWIDNMGSGDGFTQFGLVLGCACALPPVVAVALVFLLRKKEKSLPLALFSVVIAVLIVISVLGVVDVG